MSRKPTKEDLRPPEGVAPNPEEPNYVNPVLYIEVGEGSTKTYAFFISLLKNYICEGNELQRLLEVFDGLGIRGEEILQLRKHFNNDHVFVGVMLDEDTLERDRILGMHTYSKGLLAKTDGQA